MNEVNNDFNARYESDDEEECLRLFLGGISTLDISLSAWEIDESDASRSFDTTSATHLRNQSCPIKVREEPYQGRVAVPPECTGEFDAPWFSLAYKCSGTSNYGRVERPFVRVVDLSAEGRGNALIATQRIAAGDVIYTERAAVATQLPQQTNASVVRACQHCFRSLEPIASCQMSIESSLPMAYLWPVPDIEFDQESTAGDFKGLQNEEKQRKVRRDKCGRVQCRVCQSWFCCEQCHGSFEFQHGSCCLMKSAMRDIHNLLRAGRYRSPVSDDDELDEDPGEVQPAVLLAVRMFATLLHHYRTSGPKATLFDGLCGDASDVTALELGIAIRDSKSNGSVHYSLEQVYTQLLQAWSVNTEEQMTFSLEFFSASAAQAARNGFGMRTQSPFKPYYAALLRNCLGGRCSEQHEGLKRRVARALGSEDGNLERGMDKSVEAKVCPEIVALFPLTARINHACGSAAKAEVRSQEFVDCSIDVVALHDIDVGEEVTISYILSGRKSKGNRQRELRAKYVFNCDCQCCQT